jgi:chemotaxis protein histidine kinase CheA
MGYHWSRKWAAVAVAVVAPLSLSGCLILPGEFTSEMTVRRSGEFSFSYKGQIQLLGLANLLNNTLDETETATEFEASCWTEQSATDAAEDTAKDDAKTEKSKEKARTKATENENALAAMRGDSKGSAASSTAEEDADLVQDEGDSKTEENEDASSAAADAAAVAAAEAAAAAVASDWEMEARECTADEVAEQKEEWEEQQATRKKTEEEQKKMFAMLLGGINPEDPETIKRFTKEVERLAAWNKVEHLGNGLFMIDYSTSGKLADDFAFPVIPRYAIGEPMIHITRWDNGRLRVEAPAFKTDPDLSVMAEPVAVKGTFSLTTDARIIANNTEEGPESVGGMEVLRWDIGPASYGAPMALLKLVL